MTDEYVARSLVSIRSSAPHPLPWPASAASPGTHRRCKSSYWLAWSMVLRYTRPSSTSWARASRRPRRATSCTYGSRTLWEDGYWYLQSKALRMLQKKGIKCT